MGDKLTDIFIQLFIEKNSDETKNLRLKGNELWQRIEKRLNNEDMHKLSQFCAQTRCLVKLDLCYNNIGNDGLIILVKEFLSKNSSNVEHLNLISCDIIGSGVRCLVCPSITSKLKTLRLNGNKLGFKGGRILSKLLKRSRSLIHLDVGDTNQPISTIQYFMSAMRNDIGTINALKIFDYSRALPLSNMYQYDGAYLAESIGAMLEVNKWLLELHLQKNELDAHDIEIMLFGLERNKTLLFLDIGYNRIGDKGVEFLAMWLVKTPQLLGLNLAGNGIGNIGAKELSHSLPFSKIRLLDIACNKITNDGMISILHTLLKPYLLRYFYFWGNTFDHKTNRILQRMLLSGLLNQEQIDVKLYTVDKIICAAYYPSNHYKHRYYCVMDHGCAVELKIKRNKVEKDGARPRAKLKFVYSDRFPKVDESLKPEPPIC